MSNSCRTFAGGAATDNITSASNMTTNTLLSFSWWTNLVGVDATARRFFAWGDTAGNGLRCLTNNTNLVFRSIGWTTIGEWTTPTVSTGSWIHVALTYDAGATTNKPVIYYNGTSQTVTTGTAPTGSWASAANAFVMGNDDGTHIRCLNGSMMGVAGWSGYILTQADVTNLANGQAPCSLNWGKLLFYYPLENGDSPEVEMRSNNTGTVTGTTVGTGPTTPTDTRCQITNGVGPLWEGGSMIGRRYV